MSMIPEDPQDRDALATVFGALSVGGGGAGLYLDLLPWYAAAGFWAVGLYLALPSRMRVVGKTVVNLINQLRGSYGS